MTQTGASHESRYAPENERQRRAADLRSRRLINALGLVSTGSFAYALSLTFGATLFSAAPTGDIEWLTGGKASAAITEGEEYYRAEVDAKPIGFARVSRVRVGEEFLITQKMRISVNVQGTTRDVDTESSVLSDTAGTMRRFQFRLDTPGSSMSIVGETTKGGIDVLIRNGTDERASRYEIKDPPVMDLNLTRIVAANGLTAGKTYKIPVFDPQTMQNTPTEIHVVGQEDITIDGKTERAWRLNRESAMGTYAMWIRDNGEGVMAEGPLGIKLVRTTKQLALGAADEAARGNGPDLIAKAAVKPDKPIENPEAARKLVVRLKGLTAQAWDIDLGRQTWDANTDLVTVTRENLTTIGDGVEIGKYGAELDREVSGNLGGSNQLEVWHPKIQLQAKNLAHGITHVVPAARKIAQWVFNEIAKENVVGVPTALQVLETRRGDCNEHTALATALLRAAGIPARMVAGVIYFTPLQSFAYHAWVEVWTGSGWLAIDPTLDQFPADATHIRLITGDLRQQALITGLIGKLAIDVVEVSDAD